MVNQVIEGESKEIINFPKKNGSFTEVPLPEGRLGTQRSRVSRRATSSARTPQGEAVSSDAPSRVCIASFLGVAGATA